MIPSRRPNTHRSNQKNAAVQGVKVAIPIPANVSITITYAVRTKDASTADVNANPDTNGVRADVTRLVPTGFIVAEIRANAFASLKNAPKTAHGTRSDAVVSVRPAMNIAAGLAIRHVREQA